MAIVGLGGEKLWLCPSLNDNPHDISGNGNNGTYNGGMGTVADVSKGGKRAYSFTSDDFIDVSGLDLGGLNKFTWSAWIYDDYPYWKYQAHNGLFSHRFASNGFTDEIYFFSRTTSSIYFQVNNGADGSEVYGSNYQSWIHACIVYDGTQASSNDRIKYYVNGTLQTYTSTFSVPASLATTTVTPVTRIGHYASVPTTDSVHYFNGKQDDIRVFHRALTTAEIKHLAKARGITGTPLKKGLGDEKLWLCPSIDDSAEDLSGNGNNGTYYGGMGTVSDGSSGGSRAYSFDGVDDYINCGNAFNPAASFSISYWINFDTFGTRMIISKNWNGTSEPYISRLDSNGTFRFYTYSGATNTLYGTTVSNPFTTGSWACVTKVYNGSTWAIYVNGSKVAETAQTQAAINNTADLYIGDTSVGGWNFDGLMDDIRFFDRALTPTEITHLASARGVAGSPYGFKGLGGEKLWLCPTLDDSAEDISGNRNHGVYQGNATTVTDTSNGGSKAYSFATGGDCIVHDQFGGPLSESQTVSWWSKHNGTSRVHQISCTVHEPAGYIGGNNNRWLYEVFNNTTERFWPNGSASNYNVTRSTSNTWRHNCWIRDNGSGDSLFYVDGVLDITVTPSSIYDADTNISNLLVGLAAGNPTVDLYIDDVRTFGRALTQEEVTHLAKSRGVLGSPHNLNGIVHLLSSFIHPFT